MTTSRIAHLAAAVTLVTLAALPAQAEERAGEISIAAAGDVMMGTTFRSDGRAPQLPPDDGAELLADVAPLLSSADLAFGNLEGPLADEGQTSKCRSRKSCFAFRSPTRYGRHLQAAGFDVVSTANNHALDFGTAGRSSTVATLNALGIAHTGAVGDIAHLTVKGRRIAFIGFTTGGDASYNLNHLEEATAAVQSLVAGGELVVVSFHGGAEGATRQHVPLRAERFHGENRGDLRRFSHAMIDAGAALVLGHGPHVVRGMEIYKEHLIAYSLGNFATYGAMHLSGPTSLSLVLQVRLTAEGKFAGGQVHPLRQLGKGGPVRDPGAAVIPVLRKLSATDFGQNAVAVGDDGTLSAPRTAPADLRTLAIR